ncbi:MAG: WYL domain-containing protein [Muribaculaceae bacterium]|nr:WYL domain-containing protein [Muribaculaceae bacterium]
MAKDLFRRYLWMIDTIRRHGRISRADFDDCWSRSVFSNGKPMPRRTFFNYREAIEELFCVEIKCDPRTYEYYIDENGPHSEDMTEWLLNAAAVNDVLSNSRELADRIFVEDVPSARQHLAPAIDAMRENKVISFDYLPYYRTRPGDVTLEPYFLKIFRQRWYITGRNVAENRIKTYALDRIGTLKILNDTFEIAPTFDFDEYFRYSFGIVSSKGEVRRVAVRTDPNQAKYFRALPLHRSQDEVIHDRYSIFYYNMRITPDLVAELLSYGPRVEVIEPPELRAMLRTELEESLKFYV